MPPETEVFLQLAKGLAHIHGKGFIYWDFKPQNVLISEDRGNGQVVMKWADFGLSTPLNDRGTVSKSDGERPENWFAPEILHLKMDQTRTTPIRPKGTFKSDVFSQGLIFGYYLLQGHHLYGSNFNIPNNIVNDNAENLKSKSHFKNPI